ncbi:MULTISPECIES: ATP-dependent nuclease [Kocuria]|nr:ATP-binding protein [Kocuria sp. HMSC066H03]
MRLHQVSVRKYRSIDRTASFDVADLTVLVGPNNNGKSNLLRATVLAMQVIERWARLPFEPTLAIPAGFVTRVSPRGTRVRGTEPVSYEWERDFPIFAKERKGASKKTEIILNFELTADEQAEFKEKTGISINENLPIKVSFSQKSVELKINKQGRGNHASQVRDIAKFIAERVAILHIAAIRTSAIAMAITEDLLTARRRELLESQHGGRILAELDAIDKRAQEEVQTTLKDTMARFVPEVVDVALEARSLSRTSGLEDIYLDDGVRTALNAKGDGVQSLVALALTLEWTRSSTATEKALIVAVEEPESHLHPGAVRELKTVLKDLASQQQVIATTHSQTLVNRDILGQNVVVGNRTAKPATSLSDLRQALGVQLSDALVAAEVTVIVEGFLDARVLPKLLAQLDQRVNTWHRDGKISFESAGSGNKVGARVLAARSIMTEPIIILDSDDAGMRDLQKLRDDNVLEVNDIVQIKRPGCAHSELEDVFRSEVYLADVEKAIGFSLNSRQKGLLEHGRDAAWSERLQRILEEAGHPEPSKTVRQAKYYLAEAVVAAIGHDKDVLKEALAPLFGRLIGILDQKLAH